jgi:hypothetical protein
VLERSLHDGLEQRLGDMLLYRGVHAPPHD